MASRTRKRKRRNALVTFDASRVHPAVLQTPEKILALTEEEYTGMIEAHKRKSGIQELNEDEIKCARKHTRSIRNRIAAKESRERRKREFEELRRENDHLRAALQTRGGEDIPIAMFEDYRRAVHSRANAAARSAVPDVPNGDAAFTLNTEVMIADAIAHNQRRIRRLGVSTSYLEEYLQDMDDAIVEVEQRVQDIPPKIDTLLRSLTARMEAMLRQLHEYAPAMAETLTEANLTPVGDIEPLFDASLPESDDRTRSRFYQWGATPFDVPREIK